MEDGKAGRGWVLSVNTDSTLKSCSYHVLHATRNVSMLRNVLLVTSIEEDGMAHAHYFLGRQTVAICTGRGWKKQPGCGDQQTYTPLAVGNKKNVLPRDSCLVWRWMSLSTFSEALYRGQPSLLFSITTFSEGPFVVSHRARLDLGRISWTLRVSSMSPGRERAVSNPLILSGGAATSSSRVMPRFYAYERSVHRFSFSKRHCFHFSNRDSLDYPFGESALIHCHSLDAHFFF